MLRLNRPAQYGGGRHPSGFCRDPVPPTMTLKYLDSIIVIVQKMYVLEGLAIIGIYERQEGLASWKYHENL